MPFFEGHTFKENSIGHISTSLPVSSFGPRHVAIISFQNAVGMPGNNWLLEDKYSRFKGAVAFQASIVQILFIVALQMIKLGHTFLRNVDDNAFWGLSNLTVIDIFRSKLTKPPLLHLACDVLIMIKVVHAKLQHIPNDYFQLCRTLRLIDFSSNILHNFPNISLMASTIEMVYVAHNEITSLNLDYSVYLENLKHLDLSHNQIHATDLTFNVTLMPGLAYLMLKNNRLSWLPDPNEWDWDLVVSRNMHTGKHRVELDLEDNPWNGKNLSWIQGAMLHGSKYGKTLSSSEHTLDLSLQN